jgi:hypothetical protein
MMIRNERAKGTHVLESGSGGTSENTRRKKRTRGTHVLESASGGESEAIEGKRARE